jgi:hypothetical protein
MLRSQSGWQIPLREASALCLRHGNALGTAQLLAVDDEAYEVAVTEIAEGLRPAAEPKNVQGTVPDAAARSSEFEGIASDGSGQVFVLQEGASRILVFDEALSAVNQTIGLSVPRDQPDFGAEWYADDNARGEGLLLLRNGHILIAKQRRQPRLIEFGPAGSDAEGYAPGDALGAEQTFPLPDGEDATFEVLQSWRIDPDSGVQSINDLALDADGRLHLISSKSRRLARLDHNLAPQGGSATLTAWDLPAELFETDDDKAEGLVFVPEVGWFVALDLERPAPNVFAISGVPR